MTAFYPNRSFLVNLTLAGLPCIPYFIGPVDCPCSNAATATGEDMAPRTFLAALLALGVPPAAMAATDIVVHRDPGCGCCEKWAEMVRQQFGRKVKMVDKGQRSSIQRARGVPEHLTSCHTALIDGMLFEGHVPIADMKRVLKQRPKGVSGLAVAGMPLGSPGMEVPGQRAQPFNVIAFGPGGEKIFARHGR